VTYLVEIPVDDGSRLLVQASEGDLPGELELAAARPGEIVARMGETLEHALDAPRCSASRASRSCGIVRNSELPQWPDATSPNR